MYVCIDLMGLIQTLVQNGLRGLYLVSQRWTNGCKPHGNINILKSLLKIRQRYDN